MHYLFVYLQRLQCLVFILDALVDVVKASSSTIDDFESPLTTNVLVPLTSICTDRMLYMQWVMYT